jgi:polyhydroxybutyrate depolymerase
MGTTMARGKRTIVVVLILISVPMAIAVVEALSYYRDNRNNGSIISSGQEREHILYVPKSYDPAKPSPLIISMHGAGLWPAAHMEMSQWHRVAEEHGFLVVYPSGFRGVGPRVWRMGSETDVRYISDLIDTLQASYNIDRTRIYADGLSNGGGMAFALSCTMSNRIAAVGLVASAQLLPWNWCTDQRPVPMIAFHGTDDAFTPYGGGRTLVIPPNSVQAFPSIPVWAENWARRNRCGPQPLDTPIAADVTRRSYAGCADNADVQLYTIHRGGHTWPGGGKMPRWFVGPMSHSVSASHEMWVFFRDHPLRSAAHGQ